MPRYSRVRLGASIGTGADATKHFPVENRKRQRAGVSPAVSPGRVDEWQERSRRSIAWLCGQTRSWHTWPVVRMEEFYS